MDLVWGDGTPIARWMNKRYDGGPETVRYLSQQFVEQLCSAEGLAVELRKEIERVVFDPTDPGDRYTAETFEELADIHLMPIRRQRELAKEAIGNTSAQVNIEEALHNRTPAIKIADLMTGDAIIISSVNGANPEQVTAITLLAGVEAILTKPGTREMSLGDWNVGGGADLGGFGQ